MLGLNKQLQRHEIKSYTHKIKNQTSKKRSHLLQWQQPSFIVGLFSIIFYTEPFYIRSTTTLLAKATLLSFR